MRDSVNIWKQSTRTAEDKAKQKPQTTPPLPDAYDLDQVPATHETIAAMPSILRGTMISRERSGSPMPSELAARCLLNESRRNRNTKRWATA